MVDPRDLEAIDELRRIIHDIVLQARDHAVQERAAELDTLLRLILAQNIVVNRPHLDEILAEVRDLRSRLAAARDLNELDSIVRDTIAFTQGLVERARESLGGGGSRDWP